MPADFHLYHADDGVFLVALLLGIAILVGAGIVHGLLRERA